MLGVRNIGTGVFTQHLLVQMRREATHAAVMPSSSEEELPPGHDIHCNHQKDQDFDKELATFDPITGQKLEAEHVDWVSPDGSLKMWCVIVWAQSNVRHFNIRTSDT